MRVRWLVASIWLCFLLRGWFYASMFPLWEGYDEFAHFGVVRIMATRGTLLVPRDQRGPRDVEESFKLVPVPWEIRGWDVFRGSLTEEQYWQLSPDERRQRQWRLRELPRAWAQEEATGGVSAYEALQPPLYYWLMAPVLWMLKGCGLPAQVMVLRWIGVAFASLALPLIYRIALAVTTSAPAALGCAAMVAVMPQFAMNAARVSNEPLSILLFTLLIWLGLRVLREAPSVRIAGALGAVLGLGLLTKAYFLAAVPAVCGLLLYRYAGLAPFAVGAAVAGWWYVRNMLTTGTISGLAESVTLRGQGMTTVVPAVFRVPWIRAVDVILVSHLYFCGWSSLGVRSWMYHLFFAIIFVAALLLTRQLRRPPVIWLAVIYGLFWIGQLYNVVLQYATKNLAGSMGWYMYAVVAAEVVLCTVAFGRWRSWAVALGTCLFGLLDLYGMHWLAIPYYTGIIGHRTNGALATLHLSAYGTVGFQTVWERLAANKPAVLSPTGLAYLWAAYLAATILPVALLASLALRRRDSRSPMRRVSESVGS